MKISCIYIIRSKTNPERFYVGSAIDYCGRKWSHLAAIRKGKANHYIAAHCKKYGVEDLQFYILERVYNKKNLIVREQFFIDELKPTFNICKIAGSMLGVGHGPETRLKISLAQAGRISKPHSNETKARIGDGNRGKVFSEIHRARLSATHLGVKRGPISEETRLRMRMAKLGKKNSPEHVAKMRIAASGKSPSAEARKKQSDKLKGVPRPKWLMEKIVATRMKNKLLKSA